jgi:hypothetical protein
MRLVSRTVVFSLLLTLIFGLASCSHEQQELPNSPFTPGQVSMTLKKGITTKQEVLNTFGSPNIVTQDSDGNSVWTYQKNASITKGGGSNFYWTVVLAGGQSGDNGIMNSTRTMTIILSFKGDTVENFKTLATNF